jgi:hypothetical protein
MAQHFCPNCNESFDCLRGGIRCGHAYNSLCDDCRELEPDNSDLTESPAADFLAFVLVIAVFYVLYTVLCAF